MYHTYICMYCIESNKRLKAYIQKQYTFLTSLIPYTACKSVHFPPINLSMCPTGASARFLFVSATCPSMIISSRIMWAFSIPNMSWHSVKGAGQESELVWLCTYQIYIYKVQQLNIITVRYGQYSIHELSYISWAKTTHMHALYACIVCMYIVAHVGSASLNAQGGLVYLCIYVSVLWR